MQLRVIIGKVQPVKKTCDGVLRAAQDCWPLLPPHFFLILLFFSPSPPSLSVSARSGEKHSGRRRGGSIQRERQKD